MVSGIAEHDADLFADLIDEDQAGIGFRHDAGEFAHRLRHQPGLNADELVAHFAVEFGFRNQRGHRVDHQHVDRPGADQHARDLERLLGVVRLGDQQVIDIDSEFPRVDGIERVFDVDERRHAAGPLRFGDHLQRDRRLADDSGPKISQIRPRGKPPTPSA